MGLVVFIESTQVKLLSQTSVVLLIPLKKQKRNMVKEESVLCLCVCLCELCGTSAFFTTGGTTFIFFTLLNISSLSLQVQSRK